MADDGLQFAVEDSDLTSKMNRKTKFIGTGAQINAITNTYPGQQALCTVTGSGFTAGNRYKRSAANNAWVDVSNFMVESAEQSNTPVTDDGAVNVVNQRWYDFVTLPTTEKFYIITGLEFKTGSPNIAGPVQLGVDVVDAEPGVLNSTPLAALSNELTSLSINTTFRLAIQWSKIIRGGTLIGLWGNAGGLTDFRADLSHPDGNQNYLKAVSYTANPPFSNNTAWSITANRVWLKCYYRGYS